MILFGLFYLRVMAFIEMFAKASLWAINKNLDGCARGEFLVAT
jgi:hypothetical protein